LSSAFRNQNLQVRRREIEFFEAFSQRKKNILKEKNKTRIFFPFWLKNYFHIVFVPGKTTIPFQAQH